MTGASAALRASVTGDCPAQRIHDNKAALVTAIAVRSSATETGQAKCRRCGQIVGVTRRWNDGRLGWSPWRFDPHKSRDLR